MISEELGWGDGGLAISLTVSGFHRFFAELSGNADLITRYADPDRPRIGCWAITEPDHGSDQLTLGEDHYHDPSIGSNCIARLDGDEYVVNGQKSAWVSNGTIAEVATLFCTIDPSRGTAGGGVCIVDLDQTGVSRGQPLDKMGQRALNQGEIFFDDVRVPATDMVIGPDLYEFTVEQVLAIANMSMGSTFVGVARAAYEHALAYAKDRIQGGVPIMEHQSVRSRLFKMFTRVEAARALARSVAVRNATAEPQVQYSIASKTYCTQTAFDVASDAVQILGGNGLSREYPTEKLLRDARASMIEDGCNEILAIVGAGKL
jgi:alkylation response protein AidB-like acyl-CoA dehydrogenase